jgi:hypothetical protein
VGHELPKIRLARLDSSTSPGAPNNDTLEIAPVGDMERSLWRETAELDLDVELFRLDDPDYVGEALLRAVRNNASRVRAAR